MSDVVITAADLAAASASSAPTTVRPRLALTVLCTAMFLASLDMFIVNVALPHIGRDYHETSLSRLSWILNGYTIVYGAVLVPAGRLADRFGRRAAFAWGLALFCIASLACAIAPSLPVLVGFRALQAAGAGILTPASLGLVLTVLPVENRQRAVRIWASSGAIAGAIGPVVGGLLIAASWRWIFLMNVPICVAAIALTRRSIPSTSANDRTPWPDLVGGGLLVLAIGAIALGIVQIPDWGLTSTRALACWLVTLIAVVGFIARSASHPSPILEAELFRHRTFTLASAAVFLAAMVFAIHLISAILFLQGTWHDTAFMTGLMLFPGPLMVPLFAMVSNRISPRLGAGRVIALGSTLMAVSAMLFALLLPHSQSYVGSFLPAWIIGGIGVGLTFPTGIATATANVPAARASTASAIVNMARQLGSVLGTSVLVVLLALTHGAFVPAWWLEAAGALAAAGIALGIPRLPRS